MTITETKKQNLTAEVNKLIQEGLFLKAHRLDYECILQSEDDSVSPDKFAQLVFETRFKILTGISFKKHLKQAKQFNVYS